MGGYCTLDQQTGPVLHLTSLAFALKVPNRIRITADGFRLIYRDANIVRHVDVLASYSI